MKSQLEQLPPAPLNVIHNVNNYSWLKQFLLDGYVVIPPERINVSSDLHSTIQGKATSLYSTDGEIGNNILPLIPELQEIYSASGVTDALEMLLGRNYSMQHHRYMHVSNKGVSAQNWHRDSFFGYKKPIRHNQIRNVMVMYYPQDTTLEMGPTAVRRGTQYYSESPRQRDEQYGQETMADLDIPLTCKAGTVVIIHYDLIHRRTANNKSLRFMFKFQFHRTVEPCFQQYLNVPEYDDVVTECVNSKVDPIARSIWNWMHNKPFIQSKTSPDAFGYGIYNELESERFYCAYNMAVCGGYQKLVKHFTSNSILKRDAVLSALALTACRSSKAVRAVLNCISSKNVPAKLCSLYTLSEWGPIVLETATDKDLKQLLQTSSTDPYTRIYLCEAIGNIFCNSSSEYTSAACQALMRLLKDDNEQVRFTAACSLVKLGSGASDATDLLQDIVYSDTNRYVVGYCLDALESIGTRESLAILLHYMKHHRWCNMTTIKSPF